MNKQKIAIILAFSLIAFNIYGCANISALVSVSNTANAVTADTPYYSVTNAETLNYNNFYLNLNAEIPKITYSSKDNDSLIDPINESIYSDVTAMLKGATSTALTTFETYLETAKKNIQTEKDLSLIKIKNKYKDIIGEAELNAIKELSDAPIEYEENRFPMRNRFNRNRFSTSSDIIVEGFTNTEDLIIPGLHNKKIIVVETTKAPETSAISETSMSIKGRPGNKSFGNPNGMTSMPEGAPNFSGSRPSRQESESNFNKESRIAPEETVSSKSDVKKPNIEKPASNRISSRSTIDFKPKRETFEAKNVASESEVKIEELTIESFYKELDEIKAIKMPNDSELIRAFLPTNISCSFEVKCLDEEYLSLFIEISESRTTSTVKRLFYNIDLVNKKTITLNEIIGENYKDKCVQTITSAIDSWSDEEKQLLKKDYNVSEYISDDTPFFINNNHKPVISLDKFSITVGTAGYLEFQIV